MEKAVIRGSGEDEIRRRVIPASRPGKAASGIKGFTLLELMVVVAIIGVAMTIAIPSYISMQPHLRLKAAASDVSSTLQLARMTAISRNKDMDVTFSDGSDSFAFDGLDRSAGQDWKGKVDIWWGGAGAKYSVEPAFTGQKVTFDPYGRASNLDVAKTEYSVFLKNIPFKSGGEEYRVKVNRLTGKVRVEHWNGVDTWVE